MNNFLLYLDDMQNKLTIPNFRTLAISFQGTANASSRWMWWCWLGVVLIAFLVQYLTLDVLLLFYKDQAQIIDYGRLTFYPESDWSVTWRMADEKPLLLWSYIGPLIAEISFQLGSPSGIGTRIASLAGGMVAATMALGWLLSRKVPLYAAFALSVAFLLDPLFVLSQRIGRMDSWVIALCLACCWLLRKASKSQSFPKIPLMTAGGLAAVAALTWPSAVLLYPLIVLELIQMEKPVGLFQNKWKFLFAKGAYFCAGGGFVLVLLLLPLWQNLVLIFGDLTTMVSQNVDSSKSLSSRLLGIFDFQLWIKLIKSFVKTFSPLFPLLAICGALLRMEKELVLVTLMTIAIIFASLIYELRALYLLPYFLVLSSSIFVFAEERPSSQWLKKLSLGSLYLLVVWSVGISLFVRTAYGLQDTSQRDQEKIYEAAASAIGPGNHRVFLGFTYEFYFAGRSLGWQLYTPYVEEAFDSEGTWIKDNLYAPEDKFVALLSDMDYAVFGQGSVDPKLEEQLNQSGLQYKTILQAGEGSVDEEASSPESRNRDVLLWFLKGQESYGAYVLYERKGMTMTEVPLNIK